MRTILVLLLACASSTHALAAASPLLWQNGGPRVRPNDSRMATLLRAGLGRSPTLRALVDRLEASHVIVYLETQPRLRARLSGCLTWVVASGPFRYVRASINPDIGVDLQIATIAHELHHALEIVEHPAVTSESAMLALYRRIGDQRVSGAKNWDTVDARAVSTTVRRELAEMPSSPTASADGMLTPEEWHVYYHNERTRSALAGAGSRFF